MFPPGALLATCHKLQGEIEQLRTKLEAVATEEWDQLIQERDKAREAARYLTDHPHSLFTIAKWPWLEDSDG